MPVRFSFDLHPPDASLWIAGDLDLAARDGLRGHLADLRDRVNGAIRIDLAHVMFIDCTCLRVLEDLRRDLDAAGRPLKLTSARAGFHRVCVLAGYDELARITAPRLVLVQNRAPASRRPRRGDPRR